MSVALKEIMQSTSSMSSLASQLCSTVPPRQDDMFMSYSLDGALSTQRDKEFSLRRSDGSLS